MPCGCKLRILSNKYILPSGKSLRFSSSASGFLDATLSLLRFDKWLTSGQFFSFKKQEPEPLPERIRLKDKTTRYAYSVTIEELNSIGYGRTGNSTLFTTDQYLVWDPESLTYTVADGIDPVHGRFVESQEKLQSTGAFKYTY